MSEDEHVLYWMLMTHSFADDTQNRVTHSFVQYIYSAMCFSRTEAQKILTNPLQIEISKKNNPINLEMG